MSKKKRQYIISLLALLWFVLIITLYFVTHKPISPDQALLLSITFGRLTVVAGIAMIAGGIGLRLLPVAEIGSVTNLALQSAFGFGVIGIAALIIGSIIGLNSLYSWLGVIILGIFFWREIIKWTRSFSKLPNIWRDSSRFSKIIGFGTLLILLSTLIIALAPPLKFDSLVYHLTLPQIYLDRGHFSYVPEIMFWGMPQLGEMLYTWTIDLAGLSTATVIGWMFGVLALLGLFGHTNKRFGLETAWVAIASLLAGFTMADSMAWGYVDWFVLLFGLGVFVYLDTWTFDGETEKLLIAGLFAGMAVSVKYTSGILIFAGIGVIIFHVVTNNESRKRTLVYLLAFMTPAILICLPWFFKNLIGTGNPFYPFFVPAGAMDAFRIQFYQIPSWGNWQDILFLPLRATIFGVEGAPGYSASIGPLLLALVPLTLVGWNKFDGEKRNSIKTASILAGLGLIIWVIAGRLSGYLIQSRLYSSILPMVAFLAGVGFYSISRVSWAGIRFRNVFGVLVLLSFGLTVFEVTVTSISRGSATAVIDLNFKKEYVDNNLGWYGPAMKAIRELPEGSEILMLWEPRSLYCLPKCIPDEIIDRWVHDRYKYGDVTSILKSWREAGYTHLLFYKTGADFVKEEDARYMSSDWEALEQLLDGLLLLEDLGGAYYFYELE